MFKPCVVNRIVAPITAVCHEAKTQLPPVTGNSFTRPLRHLDRAFQIATHVMARGITKVTGWKANALAHSSFTGALLTVGTGMGIGNLPVINREVEANTDFFMNLLAIMFYSSAFVISVVPTHLFTETRPPQASVTRALGVGASLALGAEICTESAGQNYVIGLSCVAVGGLLTYLASYFRDSQGVTDAVSKAKDTHSPDSLIEEKGYLI